MLVVEKEVEGAKILALGEDKRATPFVPLEVFRAMAMEDLDFTKPIKHSNLLDVIFKKIVPNTPKDFKWYLNLFPREEGSEDRDYKEVVAITIGYKEVKSLGIIAKQCLEKINGKT